MSIAKVTEVISSSAISYEDAVSSGVARANQSLKNVKSAWVTDHSVNVGDNGEITEHRVRLKVTFVLA